MPQVPRSPDTQVRPAPIPGVRAPSVPAGAFDYGSGLQKVTDVAAAMYQREKQRADQVAILDGDNQLTEHTTTLLNDPDKGALTRRGKDALGIVEPTLAEFDRAASEVEGSLSNRSQRDAFTRMRQAKRQRIHERLLSHSGSEQLKYDTATTEAFIVNTRTTDPAAATQSIERQQAAYQDFATHYSIDAETQRLTLEDIASKTRAGVVTRMLANHQDVAAKAYYDAHRTEITEDEATRLEAALTDGSTQGAADRVAEEVWASMGPETDTDPVQIDQMADRIRTNTEDPKVQQAALTNLNQRIAVHHAAVTARAAANEASIWNAYDAGTPAATIYRSPEYLALAGTGRKEIRDKIAAYQDKAATQARQRTKEDRDAERIDQEINYGNLVNSPVALREADLDGMLRNREISLQGHKALNAMKDPLKSQQARAALSVLNRARTKKLFNADDPADNEQRWATYTGLLQDFIIQHPDEDPSEFVERVLEPIETTWKQRIKNVWFSGSPGTEDAFAEKVGRLRALAGDAIAPRKQGPAVGEVQQGYRFTGGDPAQPSSWEKVP